MRAASKANDRRLVRLILAFACIAFQATFALSSIVMADEPLQILTDGDTQLRPFVRGTIESGSPLDPQAVARDSASARLHPVTPPNFGRHNQPAWGHVTVVNRVDRHEWVLRYNLATVEDVRVFVRAAGEPDFRQLRELGEKAVWPFSGYRGPTYLISLHPGVPVEIVTRLQTRAPIGFHLSVSSPIRFFEADRELIASTAILGAVPLVVVVYVGILAGVLRHRGLVSLIVILLTKLIIDAWITGFGQQALPFIPRASWPSFGYVVVCILNLACLLHIRRYLDIPRVAPRINILLLALAGLVVGLSVVELTGLYNVRLLVQVIATLVFAICAAMSARFAWKRPSLGAVCYALAWGFFLSEALLFILRLVVLVPFSASTMTFSQSAVASILFGLAIFRRIKDQDQALNRSLADSNERFQLAIDGSAAAIYEYSFTSGRFYCAPRLSELLAVPDGTPLPRLLTRLARDARKQLLDGLQQALADRARNFRVELLHTANKTLAPRFLVVTGAIQYDAAGERERICGSVIDVTSDRVLAVERQLRTALSREKERAERALTARTIFYASANHDLRHPLLSLGLYLQMLVKDKTASKLQSFLPAMLEAHRSAFRYLDHIVELARGDIGSSPALIRSQPLQPIFSRLLDQYRADATQASLSLRFVATKCTLSTDAFLLDRILSNLLSNAIRNTRTGSVLIGCRRLADGIRIDVIDTGPGLAPEIYQRVKDNRLNGALIGATGTVQLGLIIVQRTAEELGCAIDMVTRAGKGTRFSVIIRG